MDLKERALVGMLGGIAATLVLSGLRGDYTRIGLVFETTPMQEVDVMEEVGLLKGWSPGARRVLSVAAHFAYGMGTGMAFNFLRRERGGLKEEAAVGAALGLLALGVGYSSWPPLASVQRAPWTQRTPKVLLPVLDHAVFGVALALNLLFGIPFALIPLLIHCRNRNVMDALVNRRPTTVIATVVVTLIVSLNVFLLYRTFFSRGRGTI